jgi:hypothetical protein
MKRIIGALLALTLPVAAAAAGKTHIKTDGQECVECHAGQETAWMNGKHGLMNVKCVVCHGSPEENFTGNPGLSRCRGCHSEQVADVEKKLATQNRTCFLCHEHHTVALKEAGFHGQGGVK